MVRRAVVPRQRPPKRHGKAGRGLKKLIAAAVALALMVSLGYILNIGYRYITGYRPKTAYLALGTLDKRIAVTGLVVKNESLLVAPVSGTLKKEAPPGERIAVGAAVAKVVDVDVQAQVQTRIDEIDKLISDYQEVNQEDVERSDNAILNNGEQLLADIRRFFAVPSADMLAKRAALDQFTEVLNERRGLFQERNELLKTRDDLKREREEELARLQAATYEIKSKQAGLVSYVTDGLEGSLTPEHMDELTPADIEAISPKQVALEDECFVHEGQPIGKVVDNFNWFVLLAVPLADAEEMSSFNRFKVTVDDETHLTAEFHKLGEQNEDKQVVILKIGKEIPNLGDLRFVDVEVTIWSEEGYVVPRGSVVEVNGEPGIYIIDEGESRFLAVDSVRYAGTEAVLNDEDLKPRMKVLLRPEK